MSLPTLFFLPSRPCFPDQPGHHPPRRPGSRQHLQGQVTCDVNALQPGQSTLGGHCDPKGKLWSDFRLLCLEDSLLMLTKPSVLARQLPELKKFAIFAKVEIGEFQAA